MNSTDQQLKCKHAPVCHSKKETYVLSLYDSAINQLPPCNLSTILHGIMHMGSPLSFINGYPARVFIGFEVRREDADGKRASFV